MSGKNWITTAEAAKALGITSVQLRRMIQENPSLKQGKHYFNVSPHKMRATYRWNIEALAKLFRLSSEERGGSS